MATNFHFDTLMQHQTFRFQGFPLWGGGTSAGGQSVNRGGQVQGDKALIGGTHEGRHRPYGGDLTLIDYTIN